MSQVNAQWTSGEDAFFNTKLTNMLLNTDKNCIDLKYLNFVSGEAATRKLYIKAPLKVIDGFLNYYADKLHICVIAKHPSIQGHQLLTYDAFDIHRIRFTINIDIDYIKLRMRRKNRTLAILFFTSKQTGLPDDFTTSLRVRATDTDIPLVPFRVVRIQNPHFVMYRSLRRNLKTTTDSVTEDDLNKIIKDFLMNLGVFLKHALLHGTVRLGNILQSMHLRF